MGSFSNLVTAGILIAFLAILFHYFCRVRKKPDVIVQQQVQVPEGYIYPISSNVNSSQQHSMGPNIYPQYPPPAPGPFHSPGQVFQFPNAAAPYAYPPAPGFALPPNAPHVTSGNTQMYPNANAVNYPNNEDMPPPYHAVVGNPPYPMS